jgi:thiamine kinase-like enzyme
MVHVLDRMPMLFVNLLLKLGKTASMRKGLRYILLIEDLSPATPGNQVGGGTPDECAAVIRTAARMHAHYWNDSQLEEHTWLSNQNLNPRMRHGMFRKASKDFESRYPALFQRGMGRYVSWLSENGIELSRALHGDSPQTLIHCDMRFDNIFFDRTQPDTDPILADWQLAGHGAATYDITYMLSGALDVDTPLEVVWGLLDQYHAALKQAGVTDYPIESIRRDYERSLLAVMQILATSDTMDMGDGRGIELMDLWVQRTFNLIQHVDLDRLL